MVKKLEVISKILEKQILYVKMYIRAERDALVHHGEGTPRFFN